MTADPRARPPAETPVPYIAGEALRAGDDCTVRLLANGGRVVYRRADGERGWGLADRDYRQGEFVRFAGWEYRR